MGLIIIMKLAQSCLVPLKSYHHQHCVKSNKRLDRNQADHRQITSSLTWIHVIRLCYLMPAGKGYQHRLRPLHSSHPPLPPSEESRSIRALERRVQRLVPTSSPTLLLINGCHIRISVMRPSMSSSPVLMRRLSPFGPAPTADTATMKHC